MARDHRPIGEDAAIELAREKAMELRVKGLSYNQIAAAMGIAKVTAFRYVAHVIEETRENCAELAEQARVLELRRIDEASALCMQTIAESEWDDRVGGNEEHPGDPTKGRELRLKAVDRLVKLNEQRAKLLGLYSPDRIDANVTGGPSPEAAARLVREVFRTEDTYHASDGSGSPGDAPASADEDG